MSSIKLEDYIRDIPDFPKPGIVFKDICPLLLNPAAFAEAVKRMCDITARVEADKVVGIESRGFIFGAAVARKLDIGFVPVRKPGKLPGETLSESYELEYGTDTVEIHTDALEKGDRVVVVDDLIATGGTAAASANLVKKLGARVEAVVFLVELEFLKGRDRLKDYPVHALIKY